MATSVAFDTNGSATDRLGALFKAATSSSKPLVNVPQLTQMSIHSSTPSLSGSELTKTTCSSSSKPPSASQGKRHSKSLRSMFSRSKIQSPSSPLSPSIEEESASLHVLSSPLRPTPSAHLVDQALELTSQELTEDISVSTTTPIATPMTSMNPFLAYIDPSPIPSPSITESLDWQLGSSGAPSTTESESLKIHSIISKAKRLSITSLQAPRPTTAMSCSTTSGASTKQPLQQAPPTKKRSSIFPTRANRSPSFALVKPTETEGQPFFKALAEARCHSILPTSKLPADSIVSMSQWKESDTLALGRPAPLLGHKSEKARLKLRKQQMDVITKAGWHKKLYVLTAGSLTAPSYMLQYTAEGKASRTPEKTYRLTKHSKVFVTDAIPGRHWVLQISKLIMIEDVTAEARKMMSRLSFKPAEPSNGTANLLLVLGSAEEIEEWLASVRQEIEILGGKARKGEIGEVLPALEEPDAEEENISPLVTEFSKREARNSESDRASWGASDKRMSYRPSVDAASSTLSSAEDKKLDSLRNSGHSRISSENSPLTPASSIHSPAGSVSYSPVRRTFFFDDTPEESGSDRGVDEPFLGQTTRITADNVNASIRPNARAIAERRRSFQPQPASPLVTEMSRPGTSGADTTPSPEAQAPAWPRTRSQRRKGPPTALLNTTTLSVVQDQPSPARFADSPTTEPWSTMQPTSAQLTEEEKDQFPAISPAEYEAVANVPIPPRSIRRQSYQTPLSTELPQFEFTEPTVTPKMHKRLSRSGEVNIMFWGNDNAPQAQNQEQLLAPSSPSQRSRKELGRSDPFDLERHLAAVSPVLPPDPMDRHSFATSASVYSDDGAPSHYSQFDDEENYQQKSTVVEEEISDVRASLVPLPLSPYSNESSEHEHDLLTPIGRANARAQALRAERARLGVSKRDSWILQQPQRSDSVTKNRRQSTRFPAAVSVRPPQPLSSRGFLNLADSVEVRDQINIRPSNMVKRSASEVVTATARQYHLPKNYRASAQPIIHIAAMVAEQRPDIVGSYSTPVLPTRKLSGSLASPPRRSTMNREPAVAHPAARQRGSSGSVSGGLGGQYGAPLAPPPSMALPMVPGGLNMPLVSRMGSLKSLRTHRSGSLREVEGGSGASSAMSIRYEDELGRRW